MKRSITESQATSSHEQEPQTTSMVKKAVSVNMDRSTVENLNIKSDVSSVNDTNANTTGVNIHMESGATINNLTTTVFIHNTPGLILTEQELLKCRDELRNYYRINCKIRLLPWLKRDSRNLLEMKDLFTNLYLIYEVPNAIEIPVHIQNYLELFPSVPGSFRALIRGKAGTGKTTLLEKLALDWTEGNLPQSYNDIPLFFLLKMKSVKRNDRLIDAIFRQRLFGRDFERLKLKINTFIDDYPEKVILLIDAVDEYSEYGSDGYIESIIHNDSLRSASVIVTSRPWRAFEILDKSPNTYSGRNYEVKGYTQLQVNQYVKRFFETKPEMAENLLKQLNQTGISTGIATIPIMCMLICILFRELRAALPDTMSELYKLLNRFLIRHYTEDKNDSETKVSDKEIQMVIDKLGELAFNGLLHNRLSFEEDEFVNGTILRNACKIGFVVQSNTNTMPEDGKDDLPIISNCPEKNCFEFFHKTFQEWFGAKYLATKDLVSLLEISKPLFTDITSCLDKEVLLRFLCGLSMSEKAEQVIRQLVLVVRNSHELIRYNENKLDLQKTKSIQEFMELIIKCNQESKSKGCFNVLLNSVFGKCSARFTNVSSMTLQAIAYMLKFGKPGHDDDVSGDYGSHRLRIGDLKIGSHTAETNADIDKLWGEFEAVGQRYREKCNILSKLPDEKLQSIFEDVKDILPKGIQHLSLANKLAFADICEFMETWKGDYSLMGNVIKNIGFTEVTNLTINGVDLSHHCKLLCRNLQDVKSLKKLDLGSTSLKSVHCRYIGEMLESVTGLQVLNLNKNKLEDISEIVGRLKYLPELTRLDFETTYLTSQSMSRLGQNLEWVARLERLYIRSSLLLNDAAGNFVDGLQKISDLKRLNITLGEQLSMYNITNLVKCLSGFKNLYLLYLDGLFSPIIDSVFRLLSTDLLPSLVNLGSLRFQGKLGLSAEDAKQYRIQNSTAELFATNLKCLPNLIVLRLTYVWIEKEGLDTIRRNVKLRQQKTSNFAFELYPDYDNEESVYIPQAVLNLADKQEVKR